MNQTFKRHLFGGAVCLLVLSGVPTAQAQQAEDIEQNNTGAAFCTRIESAIPDAQAERFRNHRATYNERYASTTAKLRQQRAENNAQRAQQRAEVDARRAATLAELTNRAQGDQEKLAAVRAFRTAITVAVRDRRAAVDTAIRDFRAAVDELRADTRPEVRAAIDAYQARVDEAIADAQAACDDGDPSNTVRSAYQADMAAALEHYKADRTAIRVAFRDDREELVETRRTTLDEVLADFLVVAQEARADLREAFGIRNYLSADPQSGRSPLNTDLYVDLAELFQSGQIEDHDGTIVLDYGDGSESVPNTVVICETEDGGISDCPKSIKMPHTYAERGAYHAKLLWERGDRKIHLGSITVHATGLPVSTN